MHATRLGVSALLTTAMVTALLGTPAAAAAVPLGGGSGIAVNGMLCTLTTIGHDGTGQLIGFTSAHCGGPGAMVAAEGDGSAVGKVVAANAGLDYAVIKFDPVAVTPIPAADGFPINGIGAVPLPGQTQWACQQSRATGRTCANVVGSVVIDTRPPGTETSPEKAQKIQQATSTFDAIECANPGDDGAPVTVGDMLVGMIRGGFTPTGEACPLPFVAPPDAYVPAHLRTVVVSIGAILGDVNAKGGPGSGFVPVG